MENNRFLLDTNCLTWFQENNPKIPQSVMSVIQNPANEILFSQVSLLEIAIKLKVGKLPNFIASVKDVYLQAVSDGFNFIGIENQHIFAYDDVPLYDEHRDPFDRLLISTAIEKNAALLSPDSKLQLYNNLVKVLW
jgi:PIN domain nuclease of toxin-antitoxin system